MIRQIVESLVGTVQRQTMARSYAASNELRNAALVVLRGQRSGRRYKVPYTGPGQMVSKTGKVRRRKGRYYTASAPGESPANRTGNFRESWTPTPYTQGRGSTMRVFASISSETKISNGELLGEILENGTGRISPRPYKQKVIQRAMPAIRRIYTQPYGRRR